MLWDPLAHLNIILVIEPFIPLETLELGVGEVKHSHTVSDSAHYTSPTTFSLAPRSFGTLLRIQLRAHVAHVLVCTQKVMPQKVAMTLFQFF